MIPLICIVWHDGEFVNDFSKNFYTFLCHEPHDNKNQYYKKIDHKVFTNYILFTYTHSNICTLTPSNKHLQATQEAVAKKWTGQKLGHW